MWIATRAQIIQAWVTGPQIGQDKSIGVMPTQNALINIEFKFALFGPRQQHIIMAASRFIGNTCQEFDQKGIRSTSAQIEGTQGKRDSIGLRAIESPGTGIGYIVKLRSQPLNALAGFGANSWVASQRARSSRFIDTSGTSDLCQRGSCNQLCRI